MAFMQRCTTPLCVGFGADALTPRAGAAVVVGRRGMDQDENLVHAFLLPANRRIWLLCGQGIATQSGSGWFGDGWMDRGHHVRKSDEIAGFISARMVVPLFG